MKKTTSRSYGLIVPAEWVEKEEIIEISKKISKFYYIIKHDKDYNIETGETKKEHYHILMTFASPLQLGTVYNKFDSIERIKLNSLELIKNIYGAKRYLVHKDNPEKFQYEGSEVETNDPLYKDVLIEKKSAEDEVKEMLDAFDKGPEKTTEREFIESFNGSLVQMSPYQRLMSILALKREHRNRNI
jgi:hypothetical protein